MWWVEAEQRLSKSNLLIVCLFVTWCSCLPKYLRSWLHTIIEWLTSLASKTEQRSHSLYIFSIEILRYQVTLCCVTIHFTHSTSIFLVRLDVNLWWDMTKKSCNPLSPPTAPRILVYHSLLVVSSFSFPPQPPWLLVYHSLLVVSSLLFPLQPLTSGVS